jgi:hypothetical protein
VRGWIEWWAGVLGRNWKPIVGTLVVISLPILVPMAIFTFQGKHRPERTMTDPGFVRAASAVCATQVKPLAEKQLSSREHDKQDDSPKANAAKIDAVADKLEAAVADLRALPHRAENTKQLNAWFRDFDDYIQAGRHYAAALRTSTEDQYSKVDDEAVAPLKAIVHFARANRIDSCIP